MLLTTAVLFSCTSNENKNNKKETATEFKYVVEQFADIKILRYQIPGFEAGKALVENYGVKVDQEIHKEVLARNRKFKSAPYSGFMNSVLVPEKDAEGNLQI